MNKEGICLAVGVTICTGLGYYLGDIRGLNVGYALAYSEQAARASEHERIMKYVGLCKWAKIWAEDTRCGKELP